MGNTLLLADDSVTMQKVVGITFANEDIDLVTVDNGDAALERARELRPDIVLADVGMPGLNGYELCAALKSDPDLTNVRVILLTGTFDTYDEARAREVGADAHVAKPFEAQALVDQVHTLLQAAPARPAGAPSAAPAPRPTRADADNEPKTAAEVDLPPPVPPAPPAPELPDLDFESLDLDAGSDDLMPEITPELDTQLDDLPAPTPVRGAPATPSRPTAPAIDPNATKLVDPREVMQSPDLMPPDPAELEEDLEAGMQTTLLTPGDAANDLFGPMGEFESDEMENSAVFGDPESSAQQAPTPTPKLAQPAPAAQAPEASWDMDAPEFDEMELPAADLDTDGLELAPAEMDFEEPSFEEPSFEEPFEAAGSTEPELSEPLDPTLEEADDLELTPGEELPWSEPEPEVRAATPTPEPEPEISAAAFEAPELEMEELPEEPPEVPAPAPQRATPTPAARPAAPSPVAPSPVAASSVAPSPGAANPVSAGPVAPSSAAPQAPVAPQVRAQPNQVPIDPAAIRQALEKVAWEAFGPLSEQIVREVVRKVEEIAWETLPQIAEKLVQEELARLRKPEPND